MDNVKEHNGFTCSTIINSSSSMFIKHLFKSFICVLRSRRRRRSGTDETDLGEGMFHEQLKRNNILTII